MTTVRRWTGHEAKLLRQAMRLSVRGFAEHLGVGARTISKWEKAGRETTPWPDTQAILDTALARASTDAKARFAQLVRADVVDAVEEQQTPAPASVTRPTFSPAQALEADESHVAAALADARRCFDGSVVDYFRRQLDACTHDDGSLGPAMALPRTRAMLTAIERSAREVKPEIRRDLLSVGTRWAEFAGWLYRDVHDLWAARFWYDRAIEWAQEARDTAAQGYVLMRKSQMAFDERDGLRMLTLAQAAQYGPWQLSARVRAEVTQQEARGLAMIGEPHDAIERKLERARTLLTDAEDDDAEDQLGAHYTEDSFALRTASCYVEAGRPQRAAEMYANVLANGTLSRRDRGYFLARRASALALAGEPDQAAVVGLESFHLAASTNSRRTKRELARTLSSLRPWTGRPKTRELREALTAADGISDPP